MFADLDSAAVARQPSQERSRERFERVLQAADALLAKSGLEGFSIPALAEGLGYTRRSIYAYFPTPYAVLNELTRRYIQRLEIHLGDHLSTLGQLPIEDMVAQMTFAAADFQNAHPVARLLILGGAVTDRSYRAQEIGTKHLGQLAAGIMRSAGLHIPDGVPHRPTVAVELGTACFRLSYANHGSIIASYKVEAAHVMLQYLSDLLQLQTPVSRERLQAQL